MVPHVNSKQHKKTFVNSLGGQCRVRCELLCSESDQNVARKVVSAGDPLVIRANWPQPDEQVVMLFASNAPFKSVLLFHLWYHQPR